MARLRSWGLLCFAVLALPGPPGAGAQGKGMRGAAGGGPGEMGGVPARCTPQPSPLLPRAGRSVCQPGSGSQEAPELLPEEEQHP